MNEDIIYIPYYATNLLPYRSSKIQPSRAGSEAVTDFEVVNY